MGSFNASCAISKCSINPGDRVKLIPIVSNTSLHSDYETNMHVGFACYSWDYFSVLGYPMDATYEDYGDFSVEDNYISKYNLGVIKKYYTENPIPEGETLSSIKHDREGYGVSAEDLDWNTIGRMIHFGSLYLDSNKDLTKRKFLAFMPVHESIFKLFMDCTPEMYVDKSFENVPFVKQLQKNMEKYNGSPSAEYEAAVLKYMDMFSKNIGSTDNNGDIITPESILVHAKDMADLVCQTHDDRKAYSYNNTCDVKRTMKYLEKQHSIVIDDEIRMQLVVADTELDYFISGVSCYNIPILPPMTAGQDYDKTDHAAFLIRMGTEMMKLQVNDDDDGDDEELTAVPVLDNYFQVSLAKLKHSAENDWRPERGKENVVLIERFVQKFPNGARLTQNELQTLGFGGISCQLESTMLDYVFINDIDQD